MLSNIGFCDIPIHIRGGAVLPLRAKGAMTTTELRSQNFQFVVAPSGTDGTAAGALYVDDGVSVTQSTTTCAQMAYAQGKLSVSGSSFDVDVQVASVWFLGVENPPETVWGPGNAAVPIVYDAENKVLQVQTNARLDAGFEVTFS
jgi:alpha-glucosidase